MTKGITGTRVLLVFRNGGQSSFGKRQRVLCRPGRPAARFPYGRVREPVQWSWPVLPERSEMFRRPVPFMLREAILRVELVVLLHPSVSLDFCQDLRGCNRSRAHVTMDQRFLLDRQVELDRVEKKVIGERVQL